MSSRFVVERIEARILDIPTIRPHKLAFGAINRQSPVVVQLWLRNGACGFGEAATIGGPSWNEESPESIRHAIEAYLAPCLLGQDGAAFGQALARMDTFCRGNAFAKSAVEMALIDAVSRTLALPAYQLLGGKRHARTAREAALLDPEGRALARSLGLPPPPLKEQPIRFIRRTKQTEMRT